jgi:DNA-binding response OmpR family regulator
LIVDDEWDIATVLKRGLEKHGFSVSAYSDPVQALRGYTSGTYDLMIVDFKMPHLNGYELCRKIRNVDGRVKVCFLSAAESNYRQEFNKNLPLMGSECFVKKPVSIRELVGYVNELLGIQ